MKSKDRLEDWKISAKKICQTFISWRNFLHNFTCCFCLEPYQLSCYSNWDIFILVSPKREKNVTSWWKLNRSFWKKIVLNDTERRMPVGLWLLSSCQMYVILRIWCQSGCCDTLARLQVHKYVNICHGFISNVLCTSLSSKLPEYSVRCEKQARASPTVHFSFISDSHDPLSLDYQRCIRDVQAVIFCAECLLQHKHHFPQNHACTMYIVTIHCRVEGCIGKKSLPHILTHMSFAQNFGKI